MSELAPINEKHRYLIKCHGIGYVGSTDELGISLPIGHCLVDTLGEDGLGTVKGNKGIPDFLRAARRGQTP